MEGSNHVSIDSQTGHVSLTGVNANIDLPNFQLKGVEFDGSLNVTYTETTQEKQFGFQGEVKLKAAGLKSDTGNEEIDVKIGAPGSAGLVVGNGDITSFDLTLTGNIKAWELLIEPRQITFEYSTDEASQFPESFVMYGDLNVLVPNGAASENGQYTTITGDFGTKQMPGFAINTDSGVVESVNIGVSGNVSLFGLKVNIPAQQSSPILLRRRYPSLRIVRPADVSPIAQRRVNCRHRQHDRDQDRKWSLVGRQPFTGIL